MCCPPSIKLEEAFEEESSIYAEEGTYVHALAEIKLRLVLGQIKKKEYEQFHNQSLVEYVEGKVIFIELKRPGEKPRKIQEARMRQLKKLGFKTYVIDSYQQVDRLLNEVMRGGI